MPAIHMPTNVVAGSERKGRIEELSDDAWSKQPNKPEMTDHEARLKAVAAAAAAERSARRAARRLAMSRGAASALDKKFGVPTKAKKMGGSRKRRRYKKRRTSKRAASGKRRSGKRHRSGKRKKTRRR
tara:strand:+ start:205 stop:588 length:384 start_codon:yes stop_codon:yes gene_type:complete